MTPGCSEKQINETLKALWPDFAYLRRELVDYAYLKRNDLTGVYWLTEVAPDRWETVLHAEAPEWESIWLPAYLTGGAPRYAALSVNRCDASPAGSAGAG